MRIRHLLQAVFSVLLLSACGERAPSVVLVHASDPHILDPRRLVDEPLNHIAFADMMDAVRNGAAGTPAPRYLVVTGDFGIEVTDPWYTPDSLDNRIATRDTARARAQLQHLANVVAAEIQGSPFQRVFMVPGNNDVYLEDARPDSWSEVADFVEAVQSRLRPPKEFVDLTACYRSATARVRECYARIDSPYVLVGFPSVSLKNADLDTAVYRQFIRGTQSDDVDFEPGMLQRVNQQDSVHRALLRRFRQVLSDATANGRKAIILTHIPDLEDPYAVARRRAGAPLNYHPERRLSPAGHDDAWNASDSVFREWKAFAEWPRVAAVLAGHFHDTTRSKYYRPYDWSGSEGRMDRSKLFVAPPLARKNQEKADVGARGFSVVTLSAGSTSRQLHWYDPQRHAFRAGSPDTPGIALSAGRARIPPTPASRLNLSPGQSLTHALAFAIALLSAWAGALLWNVNAAVRKAILDGVLVRGQDAVKPRVERSPFRVLLTILPPGLAWVTVLIADVTWDKGWRFWPYATFWLIILWLLALLIRVVVLPRLLPNQFGESFPIDQPLRDSLIQTLSTPPRVAPPPPPLPPDGAGA